MTLTDRFTRALVYATTAHAGQMRKGTTVPYLSHLLLVTGLVLEHGGTEDEAIGALLHDAVEDARASPEDIQCQFGPDVLAIVLGCSDTDQTPKPPWHERKTAYLAHLPVTSASVRLVSSCDKLANVRSIIQDYRAAGESLWTRFNASREDLLWYYRGLADAFNAHGPASVARELEVAVAALERMTTEAE